MTDILRTMYTFEGRCGREWVWVWGIALNLLFQIYERLLEPLLLSSAIGRAVDLTILLFLTALLLTYIPVLIRRLHDRDKSGWWLVPYVALPSIAWALWAVQADSGPYSPYLWIAVLISIWPVLELYFLRGTIGPNRFGPDPAIEGPAPPQ